METRPTSAVSPAPSGARRKRRTSDDVGVRYFLPKPGSSPARPELGQELATEGDVLIKAFQDGQLFYTLTVWKAVPEVNGGGSPVIVKQPVTAPPVQS